MHSERLFPKPLARWAEIEQSPEGNVAATLGKEQQGTLLVDRMGLLARLYRYGNIAYVGGGFTDGIHSLLEAAAWGVPVIFGPDRDKFPEAQALIDVGAGVEVKTAEELKAALHRWIADPAFCTVPRKRHHGMCRSVRALLKALLCTF